MSDLGSESTADNPIGSALANPKAVETATHHGDTGQTHNSSNNVNRMGSRALILCAEPFVLLSPGHISLFPPLGLHVFLFTRTHPCCG